MNVTGAGANTPRMMPEEAELARVTEAVRHVVHGVGIPRPAPEPGATPPVHLWQGVESYLRTGGKFLRSALLLWACELMGGRRTAALPVAAGVEIYHTWTLVHDDIIDRDARRRGGPSVHEEFRLRGAMELELSPEAASHYGLSLAILAGDVQHAWAVSLLAGASEISPEMALRLIADLETDVLRAIAEGEALDLLLSHRPLSAMDEGDILDMMAKKTAALYEFAARAGAVIGLGQYSPDHFLVAPLAAFGRFCGMAFQLQDDILGLEGEDQELGKPVGSDIREGKRTVILHHAWRRATPDQQERLMAIVGDPAAKEQQVREAIALLGSLGGMEYAARLSRGYLDQALLELQVLPDRPERRWLEAFARSMVSRRR